MRLNAISLFALSAQGLPTLQGRGLSETNTILLPPTQDSFYTATRGFETAAPGQVLRIRRAPGNPTAVVANSSAAYNIVYRTTDSRQRPSWAVTTLFVPISRPGTSSQTPPKSLLSYQDAYDAVWLDASPSYTWHFGAAPASVPRALGDGWHVNVPDYEGPLASFTAGAQAGHAVLDSIRAMLSAEELGLDSHTTRCAMWGYSGGGLATGWAAELQPRYAPEMRFVGASIGAPPVDVLAVINTVNRSPAAGLVPAGMLGITNQHPEARAYLLKHLRPAGEFNRTIFLSVETMTWPQYFAVFQGQDVFRYFDIGAAVLRHDLIRDIAARDGLMGRRSMPKMPLFVYMAVQDDISPIGLTDGVVERYCAGGANVLFQRNTVGDHADEAVSGLPRAYAWLTAVLGGTYASEYNTDGCIVENVTISGSRTSAPRVRFPMPMYLNR